MSLLAFINFGIYLVLSRSHAYNTLLLASIYFGEIISCTKFTKINGKPIFQVLQYTGRLYVAWLIEGLTHAKSSHYNIKQTTLATRALQVNPDPK